MYIIMHCLGMPFNGDTIKEKSLGGSETAAYYVAKGLVELGHKVTLFTNDHESEGEYDGVKYVWAGEINERSKLGHQFEYYATSTPHDICIIQRAMDAFTLPIMSKVNLLWNHDLALHRYKDMFQKQLWNIDGILTVSNFHAEQIKSVYGVDDDILMPIQNGIDLSLYKDEKELIDLVAIDKDKFNLLYISRPERGLENLVAPGGIMDRLWEKDKSIHLNVCGYDNTTPQMASFYQALWRRCEELPNVTHHGSLTKPQLAELERNCDLMTYPTEFEEVSCITAMECMAAGLPFLSSHHAALPETCAGSGSKLLPLENGMVVTKTFVKEVIKLKNNKHKLEQMKDQQLKAAERYDWKHACNMVLGHIDNIFAKNYNPATLSKHFMANSDIYALKYFLNKYTEIPGENTILDSVEAELEECYKFMDEEVWGKHYEDYYQHEAKKGVTYGPEKMAGEMRFESVSRVIADSPPGSVWLDYGCAHGHFTVNLAKRFPDHQFYGIDITQSNIDIARKWAEDEGINNVQFAVGEYTAWMDNTEMLSKPCYDGAIVAEVLEHMRDPWDCTDTIQKLVKEGGRIIITTPSGPWEAIGYKKEWPWRAHVHHFERTDIVEVWGHNKDFKIAHTPSGGSPNGNVGNFIYQYENTEEPAKRINYDRKFAQQSPKQTVSLCMIVKDAERTILNALDSVMPVVDEVIINVDETTTDNTYAVISDYLRNQWHEKAFQVTLNCPSPIDIGFDEARNATIEKACGDWILWMDADEVMHETHTLQMILRNNQYNGYAVKQHHMSAQPIGVLKTDMPVRLFRNHLGISFYGVVHEHPEIEINGGVGHTQLLDVPFIVHQSYTNEHIRRNKFQRNLTPLAMDRKKYPERTLGKMLWLRDLAQMNTFELEQNGGNITPSMVERAKEGVSLWEDLVKGGSTRMAVESLDYYSVCTKTLGKGFDFGLKIDARKNGPLNINGCKDIIGHFASSEHVKLLFDKLVNERTADYERPYQ